MKVTERLRDKIESFSEGFVFSYDEFGIDADKESAFKKAMSHLVKSGNIERLSKGRFYKPTPAHQDMLKVCNCWCGFVICTN